MKFRDLLHLPYNARTGNIDLEAILDRLPNTPVEVAEQAYQDHGRNTDHQQAYGELDIGSLAWSKKELAASNIQSCFVLSRFSDWPCSVSQRLDRFQHKGWKCIDGREEVQKHWQERQTWIVEPIFLQRQLVGEEEGLHLFEGHTRLGVLRGLLRRSFFSRDSVHTVWYGA